MNNDLAIWHKALPDCDISINRRPDGSSVMIIHSGEQVLLRVLPQDPKGADLLIRRIKLDLLLASGKSPTREVIGSIEVADLPTYTNGRLYKTRAASLWERRRLSSPPSSHQG